ncbi:Alpha/Beta hydrolase protein [Hygrophoropsis aurantiaca]|uniref:Alpha/Beta hydrolase protein n=1 Tax=Hygrophoropsis aurantiaca TaxID=72124 RepID=A0ACB8ARK9_9AGAM|nr:Alpha/Beta hydrolase protein [Hygrophoropsis aurantiaca]
MLVPLSFGALLAATACHAATVRSRDSDAPTVSLDYGTFQGFSSVSATESFLGIPFAQPPVGDLRFNFPVPPTPFSGIKLATAFGNACPQQPVLGPNETLPNNPGLQGVSFYLGELQPYGIVAASEDCLYLNVVRPGGISEGEKLPVVVWMYGGAFESGDASSTNGTDIVARSLSLKTPVLQVSFNYRMNAFGFLGGKEVQDAGLGNFGLYDQRLALEWVHKYIGAFGGDPNKVIIWGQSSGSISSLLQMVAFDGQSQGLFHGAVMESGTATPLHDMSYGQANYNLLVNVTNCTGAVDTLSCLRAAPYSAVLNGVLQTTPLLSYQALNGSWHPLVDGIILKQTIRQSLAQGKYAKVPVIAGDVDDEGTLFSLYSFNVTTNEEFLDYISSVFLVGATEDEMTQLGQLYPDDPAQGSPYDTGSNDTLTPEFKRISAFQGDFYFQAPRRYALSILSKTQDAWSYLWKRNKYVPGIGSFHESDLQEYYNLTGTPDFVGTDALINFAYTLNPNVPASGYPAGAASSLLADMNWPQYQLSGSNPAQLLTFEDPNVLTLSQDNFRSDAINFLNQIQDQMGL